MNQLGVWDYLIIVAFLLGVTAQGLAISRRQKSLKDYFLAGGKMPWWAVSISLYASLLTPMSFVGVTGWVYQKDSRWFIGSTLVGLLTIYVAALIWVPLWDRLRPLSIYEYLERRFAPSLRTFGAIIFMIQMVVWIGNELVTTAGALEHVTRIPALYCLVGIVILNTLYEMAGGSRADIWTDVAQFTVLLFAFIVIALLLLSYFDWQPMLIYELASSRTSAVTGYPPTRMFSAELDASIEGTIWAIIFIRLHGVLGFGTEQVPVQRLMATGSRRHMYMALIGFAVVDLIVAALVVSVSWGFVAFYHTNPAAQAPDHPDQILVNYALNFTPVIVRGLILAGLLAALMSSYGSGLNSISSVFINDFYRRFLPGERPESHHLFISRLVTVAASAALLLFASWQYQHREVTALQRVSQLSALVSGPVACFFMLGVFSRRTNTPGALVGGLVALIFSLVFNGIPNVFEPLIKGLNWMWIGGLSTLSGLAAGYLASLLFNPPPPEKLKGLTLRR
jgi:SSS family transporter